MDFELFVKEHEAEQRENASSLSDLLTDISTDEKWDWNWTLEEMMTYFDRVDEYRVDEKMKSVVKSLWMSYETHTSYASFC